MLALERLLKERRIAVPDLAERLGISPAAVYKWLRGGPIGAENALRLGEILAVSPNTFRPGTISDDDLVVEAVRAVKRAQQKAGISLEAETEAKLVAYLFRSLRENGTIDADLVDLVVGRSKAS